nr:immunoglobulin light chain junction region [Macaca mulatta]MOW09039.1 immunoglobulin light chain junction region [Macaca mulatta]MOW09686.1 immunoglobulin light chain junction region [Macaca mulatta]MOW12362.1 immunoglobulin light chain junction region [Macaca mulatta]MOW12728.1 immunoglobulin light chain junction region [Macaca mulatta]
CLQYVNNPFTF